MQQVRSNAVVYMTRHICRNHNKLKFEKKTKTKTDIKDDLLPR